MDLRSGASGCPGAQRVALINQRIAERHSPNENPVGQFDGP
jgi:hypothetical protein